MMIPEIGTAAKHTFQNKKQGTQTDHKSKRCSMTKKRDEDAEILMTGNTIRQQANTTRHKLLLFPKTVYQRQRPIKSSSQPSKEEESSAPR